MVIRNMRHYASLRCAVVVMGEKEEEGPTTMEIQGEIREVYASGKHTQKWLARHYGKSQQAISLICKGVVKGSLAVEE